MSEAYSLWRPVLGNEEVAAGIYLMRLEARSIAQAGRPGQFVMVRAGTFDQGPLLNRPFSLHRLNPSQGISLLYRKVGQGTALMARVRPGDEVFVSGPFGQGFDLTVSGGKAYLAAGGMGLAPIAPLAQALAGKVDLTIFYGVGSSDEIYQAILPELESRGRLILTSEDGANRSGRPVDRSAGQGFGPGSGPGFRLRSAAHAGPHRRTGRSGRGRGPGVPGNAHGLRSWRLPGLCHRAVGRHSETTRLRAGLQGRSGFQGRGGQMVDRPDLRVNLGGLTLKNPVMTASGTFGYGREFADFCDPALLGAVVVKGLSLKPRPGNPPPRIAETSRGMLNAIGLENVGVEVFIRDKLPWLREQGVTVVANIFGESIDEYAAVTRRLGQADDVAMIEVNISCPNVKRGGLFFGADPRAAFEVIQAVVQAAEQPVMAKLTPMVSDIASVARAVVDAGAAVVSLINTIPAMAVDLETRRPVLANHVGGLSGPAIKPVALRQVWQVAQTVDVPVRRCRRHYERQGCP